MDKIFAKAPKSVLWHDAGAWRESLGLTGHAIGSGRIQAGESRMYDDGDGCYSVRGADRVIMYGDCSAAGLGGFSVHDDTPANREAIESAGGEVLPVFGGGAAPNWFDVTPPLPEADAIVGASHAP